MKKYEIVSEYIEQLLNAGATELPPENVIASRLGVSRCPVRQAIRDFENRGLIVTMPGVGTFVRGADHPALRKLVRRNKRIGVVTFALLPSAAPMFMGIQNTLNAHGYTMQSVYELPVGNEPVRSTETIDGLAVDMIDGALVIPPNEFSVSHETLVRRLEEFRRESGLPVIVLERRLKGYSGSSVSIDNAAGSALAVEAFLAADAVLSLAVNVLRGCRVYPEMMARHLRDELPFLATENILMRAVSLGGDRQELHEAIREYAVDTARRMKETGCENDLAERLLGDERFRLTEAALEELMDVRKFVGMAPEQAERYVLDTVRPVLERNAGAASEGREISC